MKMNKKQYNNVIENTLKHEQSEDSLGTARAIFNNMGVALPQGDIKTVYETISTDNYMGWKSCSIQEAQTAADNGTAAIGISEDKIVVLAANDEEQPVAQTASVMTLDENTSAYAVAGLEYYSYSYGGTTCQGGSGTTVVTRQFNSSYLINQTDATIMYPNGEKPGTENRAFLDSLFYGTVCGKTGASGTIRENGCAICSLAMFLLYKNNQSNTNNNTYYSVKAATIQATNNSADILHSGFSVSYGGSTATICAKSNASSTKIENALNNGSMCIVRIKTYHYVLIHKIDYTKTGTDKYLVADPSGGQIRTLTEAMARYGLSGNISNLSDMYSIS